MFEIPGSRKGYYQWDLNQRLYIQDGGCNEVHFCSEKHPEALTCPVQEELGKRYVQVPNILLQSCLPIAAFFYVKGEADAYTKRSFYIDVEERPKPDDYVYTETEVKTWESAVEYALQEAKESGAFRGEKGDKGDKGDTGEQGPQGEKGDKGDGFLTERDKVELSISCEVEGQLLSLKDAAELPLAGLKIFGKTTQGGTPTPDAPVELVSVGNGGSISVMVAGKNLFHTTNENATYNSDGTFIINNPYGYQVAGLCDDLTGKLPKGKYTLSYHAGHGTLYVMRSTSDYSTSTSVGGKITFDYDGVSYLFILSSNVAENTSVTYKVQLEVGDTATEFEAYKEPQTIIVSTPNGLPGIPVSVGGNYTDKTGQQWLAHIAGYVLDGQIGELVTTGYIENYAGETIPGVYLSSTGVLDVGASVRYALEAPVFVPYAADVQKQWRTLRTNKLNTTIYDDCGAWMRVSYAADTKTYIDNKFNELAAAIVNNT